jgi:uncharacterized membrane protein YbhN (UPF0104 family)
MHYFAFLSFQPTAHLGLSEALLVFDFGTLGIVFPSPGGMGTYHAMIGEGLKIFGIEELTAFSFSMITFITLNIGCNALFGLISLVSLPIINKKK